MGIEKLGNNGLIWRNKDEGDQKICKLLTQSSRKIQHQEEHHESEDNIKLEEVERPMDLRIAKMKETRGFESFPIGKIEGQYEDKKARAA